jgi:hypothetical protein
MSYPESLTSYRAIVIGSVLVVLGLALIVGAAATDESMIFVLGGMVVIGGVLRLTTALSKDARQRRQYAADPNDPRWDDASPFVQLAGRSCVECERKITVASDANACEVCAAATHLDCQRTHYDRVHEPA